MLFLVTAIGAWGCSCYVQPSAKGAWEESALVFVGRVEQADFMTDAYAAQNSRVRVEEAFKGIAVGETVGLEQPSGMCSPKFREAERVLLYLQPGKSRGKWVAYPCTRTRWLEEAADDLLFLRALPGAAGRNRLSGQVVDRRGPNQRPMAGVTIRLQSGNRVVETATNGDGVFEVYDLVPGTYEVTPLLERRLKVKWAYAEGARTRADQIQMGEKNGMSVVFWVADNNFLSGRVVDPEGKPLPGVCVGLETNSQSSGCSDADGAFRISDLPSGTFRLVANKAGRVTPDNPFGAVYSTELTVRPGERIEGVEIRIPRMEKLVYVSGRVVFRDGAAANGATVVWTNGRENVGVGRTDATGAFRVPAFAGQAGRIYAMPDTFRCKVSQTPELAIDGGGDVAGVVLTLPMACR